jgi:hypothetical protein
MGHLTAAVVGSQAENQRKKFVFLSADFVSGCAHLLHGEFGCPTIEAAEPLQGSGLFLEFIPRVALLRGATLGCAAKRFQRKDHSRRTAMLGCDSPLNGRLLL